MKLKDILHIQSCHFDSNVRVRNRHKVNILSLSTTTKITSNPYDLGNPSIKCKLTSVQGVVGTFNGCSKPAGIEVSDLIR